MTSIAADLQELRRRRRTRRIVSLSPAWRYTSSARLNSRKSTMSCGDWQAEYTTAVLRSGGSSGSGTQVNLEKVRPEGCPIPFVPGN